jgi:pyridoxine 5-phosphate synthase
MTTALSVNVNKIAVLRNSRGGDIPDPLRAAMTCIQAGCQGITVHPRPDQRHIRHDDVVALRRLCDGRVEFNIEGNPFAPPRAGYPGLIQLAEQVRPEQCTLVPDSDAQLTSDHGFVFDNSEIERLRPLIERLHAGRTRVSVFVNAGVARLEQARFIGIDRIELYTGPYAAAWACGDAVGARTSFVATARAAQSAGLGVNAGHDLSQTNLAAFLASVPGVLEVSIGHALIAESLDAGLDLTVRRYLEILRSAAA